MKLKFLERDERVPYIAEALEVYQKARIGEVRELYRKGKRPALILVDFQEGMTSPDSPMGLQGIGEEATGLIEGAVENSRALLEMVRGKGFPVIYLVIAFAEEGNDGGAWGEKNPALVEYCRRGSRWVEVDKRLKPAKGDYRIEKKVFSGFLGTPLHQILTFHRVDTCVMTGLSISGCVRQTTIDAVSLGYYAVIPEECVGDRSIGPYKASLFDLWTKTADVAPLAEVLGWLEGLEPLSSRR